MPRKYTPIDTAQVMPTPALKRAYRYIQPAIEGLFGFPPLWEHYDACAGSDAKGFAAKMLQRLNLIWEIPADDLTKLQAIQGPIVINCNHAFGGVDSMALILTLEAIRPDNWRMLSNFVVSSVPEFGGKMIAVDPLGSQGGHRISAKGLATALRFLKSGGILGMFPAGRVSHFDKNILAVSDLPWSDHAVRLAEKTNATIVTLHIPGQNSDIFLKIPTQWSRLRALMLCREMTNPTVGTVKVRVAEILPPGEKITPKKLQSHCFLRSDLDIPRPATPPAVAELSKVPTSTTPPVSAFTTLTKTHQILETTGLSVLLFRGEEAPDSVMNELGRCREITFRAAGQGVGSDIDLTPEDPYYHHLVLWDCQAQRLIGAYRMGKIHDILDTRGPEALYLDHIFKIQPQLYDQLGPSFELSRSFILPEFQKDPRALAALWKGLGLAAIRHKIRSYFGSVTISNNHHPASRAILVEYLRQNHGDTEKMRSLVTERNPFTPLTKYHKPVAHSYHGEPVSSLCPLIERIENNQRGIPPLIRYYCSLGAKFLAYHVEPTFQDALYCLLRVDLPSMDARYRKRFMGF
jgi:putative hemolysin